MYLDFFGLSELPFSIAPDPRYLYMSERHKEALAHLLYGVSGQGGFVLLTGEVGTGKTTICRSFLNQVPKNTDVAFIVNPKLSARELMATICDELHIQHHEPASIKKLNDLINDYLLKAHSQGRHTVLIIDEAQNLRIDVLEQLRLLTNLETSEKKLLQIVLLGQPELRELLAKPELRQLSQRITARYHLKALDKDDVNAYVKARLGVAGRKGILFTNNAVNKLFKYSKGIPRLINLIADRALLGAYANHSDLVEASHVKESFREIRGEQKASRTPSDLSTIFTMSVLMASCFIIALVIFQNSLKSSSDTSVDDASLQLNNQSSSGMEALVESESPGNLALVPNDDSPSNDTTKAQPLISETSTENDASVESVTSRSSSQVFAPNNRISRIAAQSANKLAKYHAFKSVLAKWRVAYPEKPFELACKVATSNGLACLHKEGNWRSIVQLDRPAILTLLNDSAREFYVGLLQLGEKGVEVSYMGESFWVSLKELDQYWLGKYTVVWKRPPYANRRQVSRTEQEAWLSSRFDLLGEDFNSLMDPTGAGALQGALIVPFNTKVKAFQQYVGLQPDGVVGAMTIIKLNSETDESIPKLKASDFLAISHLM